MTSSGVGRQIQCLKHYVASVVSMADHGSNINVSQFFATWQALIFGHEKKTVFGKVIDRLEVSEELEKSPVSEKT